MKGIPVDSPDYAALRLGTYLAAGESGESVVYRLSSHFQPIFSIAHRRPVGFEGLIRATDMTGKSISPIELLEKAPQGEPRVLLDRQCRGLHVRNFLRCGDMRSWLFLNVDPYTATASRKYGSFFSNMLQASGFPAHRVAVELIETPFEEEERLADAIQYYRDLGCIIVIDDFGAGYSNFDRVWRLKPDIVKIDREMTRLIAVNPLARRMFSGITSVLHEAGALVCVEGVETETEALCAIDADADLIQGYYFARPRAELPARNACEDVFARLFMKFRTEVTGLQTRRNAELKPYLAGIASAVQILSLGADYRRAIQTLLELDCTQRCYLIAGDGSQIGENREAKRNAYARDPRFEPMQPVTGTNWQTKPYFRRAIGTPGKIQVTRPYMSVTGPKLCLTLSLSFAASDGSLQVLCVDLDFEALAGHRLSFGIDIRNEESTAFAGNGRSSYGSLERRDLLSTGA